MQLVLCVMTCKQGLNQVSVLAIDILNMLASHAYVFAMITMYFSCSQCVCQNEIARRCAQCISSGVGYMFGHGESWVSNICLKQSNNDLATVSSLLHHMQTVEGHFMHCPAVKSHHDIKMHDHKIHAHTEQFAIRNF